jgi:surface protein
MKLLYTPLLLFLFVLASCTSDDEDTNPTIPETITYQVSISASPSNGGTVSPESGKQEKGNEVDIIATPADGWEFKNWNGDYEGNSPSATITIDEAKNITANFSREEEITYALTVTIDGEGMVVDEQENQVTDGEYGAGTVLQLTAEAKDNWEFDEWQGDVTGTENPVEITIDEIKNITANFSKVEEITYALTVTTDGEGTVVDEQGNQLTNGEYGAGTVLQLTAEAKDNWEFDEWQGDVNGAENIVEITIDEAKGVTAVFVEKSKNLFYLADNGVTIKGPDAAVGESGVVNGITYTKRSAEQITTGNAETTCTSGITNMRYLFLNLSAFNEDISSWDVSSVTDMSKMFVQARAFNGFLNNWDVSNVTDMSNMFSGASSFNKDISSWNVSSVTNMSEMFSNAESFNSDIGDWDVSNVTNMEGMFLQALIFNGGLNNWDVSSVTDMSKMFKNIETFNQDLNNWNTSSVMHMDSMFRGSLSFNQNLDNWDVSNVETMGAMFKQAVDFNGNIGRWDVSSVTDMRSMFWKADNFDGDISDWNVSNVSEMSTMFFQASSFNRDLSNWCVSLIRTSYQHSSFAVGSNIIHEPIWGTCPGN